MKRHLTWRLRRCLLELCALLVSQVAPVIGFAQASYDIHSQNTPTPLIDALGVNSLFSLPAETELQQDAPILRPNQALQVFQSHDQWQVAVLQGYTDDTVIIAALPETSQEGALELQRDFVAPRSLKYKAINFTGNTFVKSKVIARVLQSEVDRVEKGDRSQTALTEMNYKFSFKGERRLNGHESYVYQVKPRRKKVGLFKGYIYLETHIGNLMRSEGAIVKSPSAFVRKVEFVQEYVQVNHYTLPIHLHTTLRVRTLGRVVVDVYHGHYQPYPLFASISAQSQQ